MKLNKIWRILEPLILIDIQAQSLMCFENGQVIADYEISSGKNGVGETENSGCTPRGWHEIADLIGLEHHENAVFVGRQWTGEIYSLTLSQQYPHRDWILTRILRLRGLEPGKNQGSGVDTYSRYIYIHGAPDEAKMGIPGSHGCIRMNSKDVMILANWAKLGFKVYIDTEGLSLEQLAMRMN